ncbi:restriction endonuclease subunit S [Shewanella sp. MF05960]|uniref:restriction endonuclease subunit S n=1 Tax=Shewanella sp. MF05960 TaxID=3434874 RepID=UPI003D7AACBE
MNVLDSLPETWVAVRGGDYAINEKDDIVDGPFGSNLKSSEYVDSGTPIARLQNVKRFNFIDKNIKFVTDEKALFLKRHSFKAGDILITKLGDPLGLACIVPKSFTRGIIVADLVRVRHDSQISSAKFLTYLLNSELVIKQIAGHVKGTTRPRINLSVVRGLQLPLPPLAEQKVIADKLDELLAKVESTKARLDAIPAILKSFRQSVLAAAVSGKLTEEWRGDNPTKDVRDLLKQLKPLPKPARYKTRSTSFIQGVYATAVGKPSHQLVKSWKWVPIVEVAKMESGHTPSRSKSEYWEGNICWIGIKDARKNHAQTIVETDQHTNELGLANSAARILPKDTICISRTASVGYVTRMGKPMATSQDFVNWVPTEVIEPDWLKWLFVAEKESLFKFGKGSTHTTVYFPEWLSMHIALPHKDEQTEIVRRVEELFAFAGKVEAQVNAAQSRVNNLTQSILAKAFRGELTEPWRKDNPELITGKNSAEALLKRIKAERDVLATKKKPEKKTSVKKAALK